MSCNNYTPYDKMNENVAFEGFAESEAFKFISSSDIQVIVSVLTLLIAIAAYFSGRK